MKNVLVIMSDQHHPRMMGCAGHPVVKTPNLDRLADRSIRFSSAYCNFPLCCPSRMSFMTARYPSRIDCLDNLAQLSSDIPTFAHSFLGAGYETVLSGRMHFVGLDQRHGFEHRPIGCTGTAFVNRGWNLRPILGELEDTPGVSRAGIIKSGPGKTGYHEYDRAVTRTTVEWLKTRAGSPCHKPFMMVAGFLSPHCPFVAPAEDYALYDKLVSEDDLPEPNLDRLHPVLRGLQAFSRLDEPDALPKSAQRRARVAYYGLVSFLDRQIGRILDALDETGLAQDTIVVYTSDHGEQLGEHGMWWKSTFYEGSAGVPMMIALPGGQSSLGATSNDERADPHPSPLPDYRERGKNGGRVVRMNVSLMDLAPTLLDLAGAPAMPGADGRSFRALIDGDASTWDDQVIAENISYTLQPPAMRMIRRGDWKFNYYHSHAPELFNLAVDAQELNNLANDPGHGKIVEEMRARVLEGWNPDEIEQRIALRQKELPLIRKYLEQCNPPEPDQKWYSGTLENFVDNRS